MTISEASKRIAQALQDKRISFEEAVKAQAAIRERKYYGNSMTPEHVRASSRTALGSEKFLEKGVDSRSSTG